MCERESVYKLSACTLVLVCTCLLLVCLGEREWSVCVHDSVHVCESVHLHLVVCVTVYSYVCDCMCVCDCVCVCVCV